MQTFVCDQTFHPNIRRASLKERLEFANEMLPNVMDSADSPLDVSRCTQYNCCTVSTVNQTTRIWSYRKLHVHMVEKPP